MTRSFAEWSRGLQDNDSFQEFLSYIRQNGPAAVDFLGSFVDALASVVEAAAPYGQAVLPILTKVLDVFASIADTPIGSSLLTAAAAFVAFNRAASVVTPMVSKLGDALFLTDRAFQQTGNSATAAGGRIGTAFKFAGVVAGIMLVNEAVNTLGNSLESADLARNLEAWARGADVAARCGPARQCRRLRGTRAPPASARLSPHRRLLRRGQHHRPGTARGL